jgi:hypothetical protein
VSRLVCGTPTSQAGIPRSAAVADPPSITPSRWSARRPGSGNAHTRGHEYGGAWTASDGVLWFTGFTDQRLYRRRCDHTIFQSLYRRGPARRRRRQRHRWSAVGLRRQPRRAASPTAGSCCPTDGTVPTGWPPWTSTAGREARTFRSRRCGTSRCRREPSGDPVVLRVDVDGHTPGILRPAREPGLDPDWFSRPAHVAFPTAAVPVLNPGRGRGRLRVPHWAASGRLPATGYRAQRRVPRAPVRSRRRRPAPAEAAWQRWGSAPAG